jgi:low temperature requirement protein LtrA
MSFLIFLFAIAMLALGVFWLVMTYRYRSRGDLRLAVAHAAALIVVGLLALAAALMESGALIGLAFFVLFVDAVSRSVLARRRRHA